MASVAGAAVFSAQPSSPSPRSLLGSSFFLTAASSLVLSLPLLASRRPPSWPEPSLPPSWRVLFTAFLAALNAAQRFSVLLQCASLSFRTHLPLLDGAVALLAALTGMVFGAFLTAARRLRCASSIRLRAAAPSTGLRWRLVRPDENATAAYPQPAKRARARWRRAISESIDARRSSMLIAISVPHSVRQIRPAQSPSDPMGRLRKAGTCGSVQRNR